MNAASLRDAWAALLADRSRCGAAFGTAAADLLDAALREILDAAGQAPRTAVVALGSYARREVCPASDVDVLLLHDARGRARHRVGEVAELLWYPLWDAGFVTGHAVRTVKESLTLGDTECDALTALLAVRHVAGDPSLTEELAARGRDLAHRRRERLVRELSAAARVRRARPGPVAEMLEPDVKEGAGGLRDVHALTWAGDAWAEPGGLVTLREHGYLTDDDAARLDAARRLLLDVRVALHRVTRSRSDRLALQEQDAVAALVGADDADALVRDLASAAREVAWIAQDVWQRLGDTVTGPASRAGGDRRLAASVVLRDGRVALGGTAPTGAIDVLEAAAAAAEADVAFERASLARLRTMDDPSWDVWERAAFLRLLRAGARAVPVFEALDHEGVLTRLLPEWEHVRSRPQRNAYHRHTVDRHLLEAVAECARLLDEADGNAQHFDAVVARACRRPELLLLGALLHDIGKGNPGDHSEVGAQAATVVARRMGLDSEGREILTWLVRHHLLMADLATRRDLADAAVADSLAERCAGDAERLRLLYLLTVGDSRATGPAAWGPTKAALLRDLFVKAAAAIEHGAAAAVATARRDALATRVDPKAAERHLARLPDAYVLACDEAEMAAHVELLAHERAVQVRRDGARVTVTVVEPDRPGLLATLAGALTVCGLDVLEANLFVTDDGLALDVFRAIDPYERTSDDDGVTDANALARVERQVAAALDGSLDVEARVAQRTRGYALADPGRRRSVEVRYDLDSSATDTVLEVHADDEVGLLYRLARALSDFGLDVRVAKVHTLGQQVVDVFYVRDASGTKVRDPRRLDEVAALLAARLARRDPG
jgi:[protein-PII] uridylyltransferase